MESVSLRIAFFKYVTTSVYVHDCRLLNNADDFTLICENWRFIFCTLLVFFFLLSNINCRCADSSILYRVTTDNTGTKGSGETGCVVFNGIYLRFIRVFRQTPIFGYQQLQLLWCWMDGQFPRQVARRE
jgi:hypothetical protein